MGCWLFMKCVLVWFRRDLRLEDHAALHHALQSGLPVLPVFIFDTSILGNLPDERDARVNFIHEQVQTIKISLNALGSDLLVRTGKPVEVLERIVKEYEVHSLYHNRDYEAYTQKRDAMVHEMTKNLGVQVLTYKDHVLHEAHEVTKEDGNPYTVFTPYKRKVYASLNISKLEAQVLFPSFECKTYYAKFIKCQAEPLVSLESLGFMRSSIHVSAPKWNVEILKHYARDRDFPSLDASSRMGIHLRFGTVSIREAAQWALRHSETYFSELLWRDFYSMILQAFPQVERQSFKPAYDRIAWLNDENQFSAWCNGQTGYPMVDAGMRQLNTTGFMHNRLRMITASFLVKHLLIDWRWGEAYFAEKLLDFDLASNNGGWQWAAGCGTDAAPYFRIFSPEAQQKKFDPDGKFIKKWIPELDTFNYPKPIIEHTMARQRCLDAFKKALLN